MCGEWKRGSESLLRFFKTSESRRKLVLERADEKRGMREWPWANPGDPLSSSGSRRLSSLYSQATVWMETWIEKSFGIVRWTCDCSRTRRNVGQEGGTSADALVTRSRVWFTKLLWNCTRKLLGGVGDNPLSVRQSLSRGSLSL